MSTVIQPRIALPASQETIARLLGRLSLEWRRDGWRPDRLGTVEWERGEGDWRSPYEVRRLGRASCAELTIALTTPGDSVGVIQTPIGWHAFRLREGKRIDDSVLRGMPALPEEAYDSAVVVSVEDISMEENMNGPTRAEVLEIFATRAPWLDTSIFGEDVDWNASVPELEQRLNAWTSANGYDVLPPGEQVSADTMKLLIRAAEGVGLTRAPQPKDLMLRTIASIYVARFFLEFLNGGKPARTASAHPSKLILITGQHPNGGGSPVEDLKEMLRARILQIPKASCPGGCRVK